MPTIQKANLPVASYPRWSLWILAGFVLLTHGMLLLNDGVYWDGWTLYGYYLNHDVESLLGIFRDAGNPWAGYFHWAFWLAPNPLVAYKAVTFLSTLAATLLIYLIVQRIEILSVRERWFIAAIFCCYSAYQAQVEIIVSAAHFTYAIFLFGIYVALRYFEAQDRALLVHRVLALSLIAFGFWLNSLLVFYFPFLILFLMGRQEIWQGKNLRDRFYALLRHADFILLPFAFWIGSKFAWKVQNEYAGYNQLTFAPHQWLIDFWQSINNAIFAQFYSVMTLAGHWPLLTVLLVILGIGIENIYTAKRGVVASTQELAKKEAGNVKELLIISLFAVFLLMCALFPYLVVGKFPSIEGWSTRHAFLISLPVAAWLVAIGRALQFIPYSRLSAFLQKLLAGLLIVGFMLATYKVYLGWQVRWIKDSSVIVNLQKLPIEQTEKINVYRMNDAYPVGKEFYRFQEYAGMFKVAWGIENKIGFHPSATHDEEWVLKNLTLRRTLLKDFHSGGCKAMITIRATHPEVSRMKQALTYWKYRWLQPAELPVFLGDFTTLKVTEIICPTPSSTVPIN